MRKSIDTIVAGLKIKDWPCTFEEYDTAIDVHLKNKIHIQADVILEYLDCIEERTITEERKQVLNELADNVYSRITPREVPKKQRKTVYHSDLEVDCPIFQLKHYNFERNEIGIEIAARIYLMTDPKKGEKQFGSIISDLVYVNQTEPALKIANKLEDLGYESLQVGEGEFANRIRRMERSEKRNTLFMEEK